jgi:uncharacterized membrane protein YdjX (TVP38/TMEM64 family)
MAKKSVSKKPIGEEVEIRRAPKTLPFAITGTLLGLIAGIVLYFAGGATDGNRSILGLLVIALGLTGLGLGMAVAIILDLLLARRPKRAVANRVEL